MCIFSPFTFTALTANNVSTDFVSQNTRTCQPRFLPVGDYDRMYQIKGSFLVRTADTAWWFFLHECGAKTGCFHQSGEFTGYLPIAVGHQLVFGNTVVSF
jgi:hypothetical protein